MKGITSKGLILAIILSLTACSTNTQSENTGIGAGTGAILGGLAGSLFGQGTGKAVAVGIGAIGGAILGGFIGHSMDSSDKVQCNQVLTTNHANQSSHWTNKNSGTTYTMTPTSQTMAYRGYSNCRRFKTESVTSDGRVHQSSGIACLQSNGSWMNM